MVPVTAFIPRICAVLAAISVAAFAGCAGTSTYGTRIDSDKVAQIRKGITTKEEVEALLGPAANVSMMGDGKRLMFYHFTDTTAKGSPTAASFIPLVGGFIGGKSSAESRRQSLQIMLSKTGVVEDYEFSDRTSYTEGSGLLDRKTVDKPSK